MYESYFQLRERPFDSVPNPAYLYLSRTHTQAMTYVRYGLQERLGYVLMTGEVGSGKTTLIRELVRTMGPEVTLARVFNTRVSSLELIAMINEDFGLDTAGKGKALLLKDLYAFLVKECEEGRRPVLIIDEAQNLSLDLLEEVRMLSNLETDYAKLLQVLLVGQPELGRVLSITEMRQFRQRIGISCHIHPLTRQETEEYILHRLAIAGNREALSFPADALDAIHQITGGIPRQINTLCNFLLLTACTEERRDLSAEMVREVAEGIGLAAQAGPDQDASGMRPAGSEGRGDGNGSDGKRALLRALGITVAEDAAMYADGGTPGAARGAAGLLTETEYPVSIRTIGLRLQTIERELKQFESGGYADLRQRIIALEGKTRRTAAVPAVGNAVPCGAENDDVHTDT